MAAWTYADQYFFNLKGKTLYISFDGPYAHEKGQKGPSYETKQMEIQMLSSFSKVLTGETYRRGEVGPGNIMSRLPQKVAVVLYVVAMAAAIVGVDFVFFRNRFWERLTVNIGIVMVFAAFFMRFLRRP